MERKDDTRGRSLTTLKKGRVVPQSLKPENEAVVVVTALGARVRGSE